MGAAVLTGEDTGTTWPDPPYLSPKTSAARTVSSARKAPLADQMVRPKKAAAASRANGGRAANKGKVVNGKEELFGGYDTDGTYVVKKIIGEARAGEGRDETS